MGMPTRSSPLSPLSGGTFNCPVAIEAKPMAKQIVDSSMSIVNGGLFQNDFSKILTSKTKLFKKNWNLIPQKNTKAD